MASGLKRKTYTYETLLNIIASEPEGVSIPEMKRDYGIHSEYDIKATITRTGVTHQEKAGEENHIETIKINPTVAKYKITKTGQEHLESNMDLVQTDISSVELLWKDGYDENGSTSKLGTKPNSEQHEILPLEEPIVLSNIAQRAADTLNCAIASNHKAKTTTEEIHVLIAKYFEANEFSEELEKESGIIGAVVAEAAVFRDALDSISELTTESLTAE